MKCALRSSSVALREQRWPARPPTALRGGGGVGGGGEGGEGAIVRCLRPDRPCNSYFCDRRAEHGRREAGGGREAGRRRSGRRRPRQGDSVISTASPADISSEFPWPHLL